MWSCDRRWPLLVTRIRGARLHIPAHVQNDGPWRIGIASVSPKGVQLVDCPCPTPRRLQKD